MLQDVGDVQLQGTRRLQLTNPPLIRYRPTIDECWIRTKLPSFFLPRSSWFWHLHAGTTRPHVYTPTEGYAQRCPSRLNSLARSSQLSARLQGSHRTYENLQLCVRHICHHTRRPTSHTSPLSHSTTTQRRLFNPPQPSEQRPCRPWTFILTEFP